MSVKLILFQFHYSNSYMQAMKNIYSAKQPLQHRGKRGGGSLVSCDKWPSVYALIASRIGGEPGALLDITAIFSDKDDLDDLVSECGTCRANVEHWASRSEHECSRLRPLSFYVADMVDGGFWGL